ncbi:MAG: PAS domain-containing protein [Burkholderiaceae bacterium]|nr:PAS domain-containing protein [Burkholderiaceae bacterium]
MNTLLIPYKAVADLIVGTFGKDCEVILHDLTKPQHSVVYVANNTVTHRQTGTGFRHLVSEILKKSDASDGMVLNYYFEDHGKLIRSSFLLIRDDENKLIGALCINIDTERVRQGLQWLEEMLPNFKRSVEKVSTPANTSVNDMVTEFIDRIIDENPEKRISREKRLEMIAFMQSRGVFLMKGSIDYVSTRLGISKVTLYSDLDEIKNLKQ